jgi:hypothetical protein
MIFILLPLYFTLVKIRSAALRKKRGPNCALHLGIEYCYFSFSTRPDRKYESVFLHGIHFNQSIQ